MIGIDGFLGLELLADVQAAHARHHDVQNHDVRRLAQSPLQARYSIGRGQHLVSLEFEVVPQPRHHVGFVFDNQDLGHALPFRKLHVVATLCPLILGPHRQSDGELAASSRCTVDRHFSAMRLHNVAHQGQPQSAALGVVNQRVPNPIEFFENLVLLLCGNADAVVHNFQLHRTVLTEEVYGDELLVL